MYIWFVIAETTSVGYLLDRMDRSSKSLSGMTQRVNGSQRVTLGTDGDKIARRPRCG